jgi:glutathione S-transferase
MITLYTFPPAFGLRNVSPFCLKVEMALTHLDMPFEIVEISDPRKAPKGKLPYVDIDGQVIADSEMILRHLDEMTKGRLYGALTDDQRAQGVAFTRLAEDHLYWIMVASRWLDRGWFQNIREGFFGSVPAFLRSAVSGAAQRRMRQTYDLHGLGRHNLKEQEEFARRDLAAISDVVSNQSFIVGDELTAFDFAVASLLAGVIDNKPPTWLTRITDDYPALRDYAERVQSAVGVFARFNPNDETS